jgi:hypothetical protein
MKMRKEVKMVEECEAHLGLTGNRRCLIPVEVDRDQREYDGKTFVAVADNGRRIRVRLVGDDYGLNTSGTGDVIVRPVRWLD